MDRKSLTPEEVLAIVAKFQSIDVPIILDGGWGTDALLGKQTRPHKDIDFLIQKKDLDKVIGFLTDEGYKQTDNHGTWWHQVWDNGVTEIDFHVIGIDETGKGIYGPPENGAFFPASSLTGEGKLNDTPVKCLTADYRIHCLTQEYGIVQRTGYTPNAKDIGDIAALCEKYNIAIPEEFLK